MTEPARLWTAKRSTAALTALLVLLTLAATGCGGEPAEQADPAGATDAAAEPATFVAVDIAYEEAPDTVAAGTQTFELVNNGAAPHTVTIEELDDLTVVEAEGGQTATGEVELEAGSYTYYCTVPGHRDAGMEGTLEVG